MRIQDWYNPRRKRFWAVTLAALYTLLGFVAVPWLLERELPGLVKENLQRDATVERISFNPWTLELTLDGFVLNDAEGAAIASFDRLIVDVQTRSIVDFALDFGEISLQRPKIFITRYAFADSNVGRMLNDMEAASEASPATQADAPEADNTLRLVIDKLDILDGAVILEDAMPATPFNTVLAPINISVLDLSTLPDHTGDQQVSIATETGAELAWSGQLALNPLVSSGTLTISGSPSGVLYRYFQDQLNFTLEQCCLDLEFDYEAVAEVDGSLSADISNLELSLRELALNTRTGDEEIIALPEIAIHDGSLSWPEQTVSLGQVVFEKPKLGIWVNEDGTLNLNQLLVENEAAAETIEPDDSGADASAGEEWLLAVGELRVNGLAVQLEDRSLAKPATISLPNTILSIRELSNQPGSIAPLSLNVDFEEVGSLEVSGELGLMPAVTLQTELVIERLSLTALQPWVEESAQVVIGSGEVNVDGQLSSGPEESVELKADISIVSLDIGDTFKNESLVGWKQLDLKDARLQLDAQELEISQVVLTEPFARISFAEDGSSNFESLATEEPAEAAQTGQTDAAENVQTDEAAGSFEVRVGQTLIENASVDFSDRSLPLPFRVLITKFGGAISALATDSRQASNIELEGQVGEFGLTTVGGSLSVMAPTEQADVGVRFKNISMPDLSGYTAEFAGRKIASGKLDLNLNYRFEQGQMQGDNKIVLSEFALGDAIDSPDAVSLPLDLALALLRDANGVIDMEVAVAGDVNDPSFSAGGILLKAFSNLIIKAATAPFKLLGSLVPGGGGENFDSVAFKPGSAELTPPELEKLQQLATALQQRPELTLQAPGGYDETADTDALQAQAVNSQVAELIGSTDNASEDGQLTQRTRAALERLAKLQLPGFSARELTKQYSPAGGELDELAYMADLRQQLEQAEPVTSAQLATLGDARGATIVSALTSTNAIDSNRLTRTSADQIEVDDAGWVLLEMTLEAGDTSSVEPVAEMSDPQADAS